jgi:hypothetical protein
LRTVALVGRDSSIDEIDECAIPDFDSPGVFGALLDVKNGGGVSSEHARMAVLSSPDTRAHWVEPDILALPA